jgi:enolase
MTASSGARTGKYQITSVSGLEILDSRARPTLQVAVTLAGGVTGVAGVPSGASTGSREAVERRDGDQRRYRGLGVLGAVAAVRGEIAERLCAQEWGELAEIDAALIELDGTPNKARLGANAVIGVSMACARALSHADGKELWEWLTPAGVAPRLPVPHFNVVNGGVHAPNPLVFQEFMIAPVGAWALPEAVRAGAEVYAALRGLLASKGHATGPGDEGGFAPQIAEPEEVLALLVEAIGEAGYAAGRDGVAIALDPAASEFRGQEGRYHVAGQKPVQRRDDRAVRADHRAGSRCG